MNDEQILEHIGLTRDELKELFQKFDRFLNGLNPAERRALLHSFKSANEAAAELDEDVTAERLEKLFESFGARQGAAFFACKVVIRPPRHGQG